MHPAAMTRGRNHFWGQTTFFVRAATTLRDDARKTWSVPHYAKSTGSAVEYLIRSIAKLELTSNSSTARISFRYTVS